MPEFEKGILEIVETLREAKRGEHPAHLLLGAGASRSAGIPLASELVAEVQKRFPAHYAGLGANPSYGACMKILSANERRRLLTPYLENAKINWAHIGLAHLIGEGLIERVLTVNFDNLLARACALLGHYPAIYDFATAPTTANELGLLVNPSIVHLHGQGYGIRLMNTDEETQKHAKRIAPVVELSLTHPMLVVGYSGNADDLFALLKENHADRETLYWMNYATAPTDKVAQLMHGKDHVHHMGGCDADLTLIKIADATGSWPPRIFSNPPGHLLDELAPVADYPSGANTGSDILVLVRERLLDYAGKWEASQNPTALILKGSFSEAADSIKREDIGARSEASSALLAQALLLEANQLWLKGRNASSEVEWNRSFDEARSKYAEAVRIKPDLTGALINWGNVLMERGQVATDPAEAARWFDAAEQKYAEAVRIEPDDYAVLSNWGLLLNERGQVATDPAEAARLFDAAEQKYAEAVRVKPEYYEALSNWGTLLAERGRRATSPAEAARWRNAAEQKYAEAVRIEPTDFMALFNWGNSLVQRGMPATDPAEAARWFDAAEQKYAEAVRIEPEHCETLNNWGTLLMERGRRATNPGDAARLFDAAEQKYAEAVRIKPDFRDARFNWGILEKERAKLRRARRRQRNSLKR